MKRIVASLAALLFTTAIACAGQSLGDAARQARKAKQPATHVFTNENLPTDAPISITGTPAAPADAGNKTAGDKSAEASADTTAESKGEAKGEAKAESKSESKTDSTAVSKEKDKDDDSAAAARQKTIEEWKNKIAAQKKEVTLSERELDVLQREYRLRAAAFYADAGNRLRNQQQWVHDDQQYRDRIALKEKQVQEAKQKLQDLQEQARKDGMPSSVADAE